MLAVVGVPAEKKHKKIIYKYIDLHMPVTRKRAGGATRLPSPDFQPSYHCRAWQSETRNNTQQHTSEPKRKKRRRRAESRGETSQDAPSNRRHDPTRPRRKRRSDSTLVVRAADSLDTHSHTQAHTAVKQLLRSCSANDGRSQVCD